jgi:hypothetical protein
VTWTTHVPLALRPYITTDTEFILFICRNLSKQGENRFYAVGNLHAHLYKVPVEILLMIFLFCDFAPISIEQPMTISAAWDRAILLAAATSVCSRFHSVLTGASEFWNVIIFTPLGRKNDAEVVKLMIKRSGERPVHVIWDCKGTRVVASNFCVEALLSFITTRIHFLSIRLTPQGTPMTVGVFEHRVRPLAMLRRTRIECHNMCTEIPFIPCGASTTMLTIARRRYIVHFDRHIAVNLPPRLTTTLVSLRLEVSIRIKYLNYYLSHCIALVNLEWDTSTEPSEIPLPALLAMHEEEDEDDDDRSLKPVLLLPKTVNTVTISHPALVPILNAPSLTHALLDLHDHHELQVINWEDWDIDMPHVPCLKSLRFSCTCMATNGLLEAMVNSAAEQLEHLNMGVQTHRPKGVIYAINALRRSHTPRLQSVSIGINPHHHFHVLWEKVAMRLEKLLAERDDLRVHLACVNYRIPFPIMNLLRHTENRIVLHDTNDFTQFYETTRNL